LIFSSGTWRARLSQELQGLGIPADESHLIAHRVLVGLVKGQDGQAAD